MMYTEEEQDKQKAKQSEMPLELIFCMVKTCKNRKQGVTQKNEHMRDTFNETLGFE